MVSLWPDESCSAGPARFRCGAALTSWCQRSVRSWCPRSAALALVLLCMGIWPSAAFCENARRLGTNLDGVTDYSPELPFRDLFLSSREWFTQCQPDTDPGCTWSNAWDTGESALLDLDSSGWVRSLPSRGAAPVYTSVATVWAPAKGFPGGRYIVRYEGQGTLEYGLGARKLSELSTHGRDVVEVDPSQGVILLRISATDPQRNGNYLRAIRFVSQKDEDVTDSDRFSRSFLEQLQPYAVLRFMDWMRTNNSSVSAWGSRAKPTDARYSTQKGVPIEIMVELANTTDKAPWFTMPHRATDEFMRGFAQTVRNNLQPDLPVYVEYSNEVWNSWFSQGAWVEEQAQRLWGTSGESGYTKRMNWHGKRTAEVCDIWKEVFAENPGRIVCVLASQAANSWTAAEALQCPLWRSGPCVAHGINALAIAPYMGDYLGQQENAGEVSRWATSAGGGMDRLFRELERGGELSGGPSGGALAQSMEWVDANREVASRFGLALISYEGGQHLVGVGSATHDDALTSLFTDANRDRRMGALYTTYLQEWNAHGGALFVHFSDIGSYSAFGSWGALEAHGETSSPKYDALWRYGMGSSNPSAPSRPIRKRVTVVKRGRGEVLSSPSGIRCGERCMASFDSTKLVSLVARPARGYRFARWKGACAHRRQRCRVSPTSARGVTAFFLRVR